MCSRQVPRLNGNIWNKDPESYIALKAKNEIVLKAFLLPRIKPADGGQMDYIYYTDFAKCCASIGRYFSGLESENIPLESVG